MLNSPWQERKKRFAIAIKVVIKDRIMFFLEMNIAIWAQAGLL
jgi:hypothetical protein